MKESKEIGADLAGKDEEKVLMHCLSLMPLRQGWHVIPRNERHLIQSRTHYSISRTQHGGKMDDELEVGNSTTV